MANPWLVASVQALQALHQKFDIAYASGRQLDIDLAVSSASGSRLFPNALARFRNCLHRAEIERTPVDQGLGKFQQGVPRLALAGCDACLDQHLFFPVAPALLVVSPRAFTRTPNLAP